MKPGPLNLQNLDRAYFAVVQIAHQAPGVLHAVVLRPDKVRKAEKLILLGESLGDQASGWQYEENIAVIAVLGEAFEDANGVWHCKPLAA